MSGAPHANVFALSNVTLGPQRLTDLTIAIPSGVTAVLGPSGAGKTSLLNILAAFEEPSSGSMTRPQKVFWVPQDGGLWPGLTVREHCNAMTRDTQRIDQMLAAFDLSGAAGRVPEVLSRGQQVRLSVARALLSDASVLVMDEPLAHVDTTRRSRFWTVIRESIRKHTQSLVFATHEPELVLGEATSVICIASGRIAFHGRVADLYWQPQSPEHAAFLGPANWISAEDEATWFPAANLNRSSPGSALCLRPEQLCIEKAAPSESSVTVTSAHFRGSHEEVVVQHRPSSRRATFWHRPAAPNLKADDCVKLGVR